MRRIRHNSRGGDEDRGRSGRGDDWDLSEGLDPEGPSAHDLDRFGSEMDRCPNCGESIYDQAEMCPQCGWYLGENPRSLSPWVMVGVFGLVVILLVWAF